MDQASLLEEIRFGYGPRTGIIPGSGGVDPDRVLAQLDQVDPTAAAWDRLALADRYVLIEQARQDKLAGIISKQGAGFQLKAIEILDQETFVSRPAVAALGFVERLVNLWSNRITISSTTAGLMHWIQSFRDEAVRPHIGGRYADLLKATLWHPGMQFYLTQSGSTGPNSPLGRQKGLGINENLAREFLELHSMGTGYSQTDVTELATLLAGMANDAKGPHIDKRRVEPGLKHVLGRAYGDRDPLVQIDNLVEDVAHRPETAQSTAHYLARHFIADDPPQDLVAALAAAYLANDTELRPLYRVLLQHPAAQSPDRQKLRSPQEFTAASLRLLGLDGQEQKMLGFNKKSMQVPLALARMGQPVYRALRPDGWPEVAAGWMTPPMMAARIDWAVDIARATGDRADPVGLTDFALAEYATPLLRQSVGRAEQRWEGLAVLIASPDFSRR